MICLTAGMEGPLLLQVNSLTQLEMLLVAIRSSRLILLCQMRSLADLQSRSVKANCHTPGMADQSPLQELIPKH